MRSSPFLSPLGNGVQKIHQDSVEDARAQKEMMAAILAAVRPLIPETVETTSGVWYCPGALGGATWLSPEVQPSMPGGRKFGIHFIEISGTTGVFKGTDYEAPYLTLTQDGRKLDRKFPDNTRPALDGYLDYDYGFRTTSKSTSPPRLQVRIFQLGGGTTGAPPSTAVKDLSLSVTSLWF